MKERKELKKYGVCAEYNTDIDGCRTEEYEDEDGSYYQVEEADAVMDAQEAKITGLEYQLYLASKRIKDLENGVQHSKEVQESLKFELSRRSSRIKELEEQSNKWEQDAYRQDERCLEFKKKYEELEAKLKETNNG